MSLLRIDNLHVDIAGPVLRDVSLQVAAGETLGLVGESGSGKSMTALSVMGLLPDAAAMTGRITLDGRTLTDLSDAQMCAIRGARIGMVFQEPGTALNPVQTIGAQVAEVIRRHTGDTARAARTRARQVLERVGLPEARFPLTRYPHDLSGGQRQRVVIAMAVAMKPSLIIADEPTTALDVTTQAQILDLLRDLVRQDGAGLLMITHDLAVVAQMADRIAIMKDGAVVEQNETLALFDTMRHPYSRSLLRAATIRPDRKATPGTQDVLRVTDLTRDYALPRPHPFARRPMFRAVDSVSLSIRRGENVGLVGESGCGKSTLARAVLGLEAAEGGVVALSGRPFAGQAEMRRDIQAVFQDPFGSFNPRWTVGRLIAEPFHLTPGLSGDERRARVAAMLTRVGLSPEDAGRYPHEFSGGQRQRIAIARALITEPRLIVLDEAVSALDVSVRAVILDLLADLSARLGVSYLFISHDLHVVRAITDRVLVMKDGQIVEDGPADTVFETPQHPYTRALLAAAPNLDRALESKRRAKA